MTLQEALENLETYGADITRWPEELHADYEGYLATSEDFSKRHDEIKELDLALAGFDDTDDPDKADASMNVGDEDAEGGESDIPDDYEDEPSDEEPEDREDDEDAESDFDLEDDEDEPHDRDGDDEYDDEDAEEVDDERFDDEPSDEGEERDGDQSGAGGRAPPPPEDEELGPRDEDQIPDFDDLMDEPEDNGVGGMAPPPSVEKDPSLNEDDFEDAEPMDIDLEEVTDLDDALAEVLRQQMDGAFDGRLMTDYTRDFDKIGPAPSDGEWDVAKFEEKVRRQTGVMQKDLQRMIVARAQSFHVGGHRSGKLNAPALHRTAAGDERIFRRKHVQETKATAITLLVDQSGSMSSGWNDKGPSKIQTAMEAAWAFADILDRLKIPNEVLGFTTQMFDGGYDEYQRVQKEVDKMYVDTGLPQGCIRLMPTVMRVYKGFAERFGIEQKRRMIRIVKTEEDMGANNDAMALEYASGRLLMRQEPRKIMIVFSDGQPADDGVHSNVIGHTMKATIARLAKQGVETIGVGIQDESVRAYYPKAMVLQRVEQLPGLVMKELRKLLLA